VNATQQAASPPEANGNEPENTLAAAIAYEQAIADEAYTLWSSDEWAEDTGLNPWLYRLLRPMLRRPIPEGFIQRVGPVTGKPYDSTGIRSVQVQMDRLDNVLGPFNWGYEAQYHDDGKRCYVRAWVGKKDQPLFERDSWGGVNQGSTKGNIWKGSFTNAAKLAFARLGPGWEVYVGAADFDPDTDEDAAKAQEQTSEAASPQRTLPSEKAQVLQNVVEKAGLTKHLDAKLRSFGAESIEALTVEQAVSLYEWAQSG
jgi:hypothetical protein